MKISNNVQSVPKDVQQQVKAKINEARELLAPYVVAMTPKERHRILKMGAKTLSFVEKAHEYAKETPSFVPAHIDMHAWEDDIKNFHELWALINSIKQLEQNLCDTEMTAGSEAFKISLSYYRAIKLLADENVPGTKAIHQALRPRFPGGRRRKDNSMPPDANTEQSEL